MTTRLAELPDDPDELRAFAAALQAEYTNVKAALEAEIYAKTLHIEKLRAQLAALRRARFGRSSEKLDRAIEQLELLIGDLEEAQAETAERMQPPETAESAQCRDRIQPVRKALPAHLPRERIDHETACACPDCGSANLTVIGADEREVLEYVPSQFKVVVRSCPAEAELPGLRKDHAASHAGLAD